MGSRPRWILSDLRLAESFAIHSRNHQRGLISDAELVNSLVSHFGVPDLHYGIKFALEQLPVPLRTVVATAIAEVRKDPLRVVPAGHGLESRKQFQNRIQEYCDLAAEFLATPRSGFVLKRPDPLLGHWLFLRESRTVLGSICKDANCDDERIELGVFCPLHHFVMLYGSDPPDDEIETRSR